MRDAPLKTLQRSVSKVGVNRYVERLRRGEVLEPIYVDGDIIVDGNHRYIACRLVGAEISVAPWARPSHAVIVPWDNVFVDDQDWMNP